jgi:DNA-directed RNA polymerase subunit RPC12/RpoP
MSESHKPTEEKHGYRCLICGGELCWENDFSAEEVLDREDDGGIVSYYHCMNCGREYEISDPVKEERETTYKKYWNG